MLHRDEKSPTAGISTSSRGLGNKVPRLVKGSL
jgi:hypothetical protein